MEINREDAKIIYKSLSKIKKDCKETIEIEKYKMIMIKIENEFDNLFPINNII